jgi:hypothetical protein
MYVIHIIGSAFILLDIFAQYWNIVRVDRHKHQASSERRDGSLYYLFVNFLFQVTVHTVKTQPEELPTANLLAERINK